VLTVLLFWAYWPVLVELFKEWQQGDCYSVGQLVPLVAIYLVWRERAALRQLSISPCWWGLGLIFLAMFAHAYGLLFIYESAERYSFVLAVIGTVLLVLGRQVFRSLFGILLFLFLMVPFPGRIHNMISGPLQTVATTGTAFLLEVFGVGVTVSQEGNSIFLNGGLLEGEGSGLQRMIPFIVVTAVVAVLIKRPRWQKIMLVASSIPIAIAFHITHLCVTAMLYETDSETAERFFHDFAGLTVMPIVVLILFGELWLMNKLVVPDDEST